MIKSCNIENIINNISSATNKLKALKNTIGLDSSTLEHFKNTHLDNIILSAGSNISKPFYKKRNNTKEFREYSLPSNFIAGIHTGETYYALSNSLSTDNIKIIKTIKRDFIEYGYSSITPRNLNIGLSSDFINSETIIYKNKIEKSILDIISIS